MTATITDHGASQKTVNDETPLWPVHILPFLWLAGQWPLGLWVIGQSLTFRIGARKTEMPVRMKTMMPVTLCSLAEMSAQSGVTWKTLSGHFPAPSALLLHLSLLCPTLWT